MPVVNPVWYRNVKVKAQPHNKSLGLENINVYPANENQKSYGIVCNCNLVFSFGTVKVTVFRSRKNPDLLYVVPPGQEKVGDTYYQNVALKYELQALVLKYVESLME